MKRNPLHALAGLLTLGFAIGAGVLFAQQNAAVPGKDEQRPRGPGGGQRGGDGQRGHGSTIFNTDVPAHPFDIVQGRPTKDAITLSVLAYQEMEGIIAFGTAKDSYTSETPKQAFKQGQPVEVLIGSLKPNTRYFYVFRSRAAGASQFTSAAEGTFHTARPPGSTFTFVVQADPHLDENTIPVRYEQSMRNMIADQPDFLIDLGDTFMTDKYRGARELAEKHYLAQRYYFGMIGSAAPVFLVLGNHDGEKGAGRRNNDSLWSNATRKKYFANPVPNDFYTGNATPHPTAGLLQDYCAWQWGDALFVTLDPFWFSTGDGREDGDIWTRSLGRAQYDWLKRTLEASRAKYKFVFLHHLVGGATPEARGGAEASAFFEWGGKNLDGSDGFAKNRPGWPAPIHDLLVKNGVNIIFHGHDHLFAHQERDGIIYQGVPQPGNRGNGTAPRNAAEYSYVNGKFLGSPGYMRMTITPEKMTAELIRSYEPGTEPGGQKNRQVDFSYTITATKNARSSKSPVPEESRR